MKLKDMTDRQLSEQYAECRNFVQIAQMTKTYAQRAGNDELAEDCRIQIEKHRAKAEELYIEVRRRAEKKRTCNASDNI